MKRLFDVIVSALVLVFLIPVFILIAVAIKLDSEGTVLFKQTRVGLGEKGFSIFKFRSMVQNSSQIGPHYTSQNDGRITKIGRFLRRTSLDELPQLLNVLKGEMSLVGPRPNVFVQRHEYSQEDWDKRNSVKPGITGLHQATLRSASTAEERLALDLKYVNKASFLLDLKIILLTVKQIIFKGGN